uniref:helix-turn-helix domain-containing protein n=1 Tax=Candidatus Regiella insecticola TaxID=138073 RepID=UPI0030DC9E23
MKKQSLTRHEAALIVGVSRPTLSQWVKSGRIQAIRKDPTKKKSPYLFTLQTCLAALNNPIHTVAVSDGRLHEE